MAMAETPLAQFINKVKTDENLRKKIIEAEKRAATKLIESRKANLDAIGQIARDEGFDIQRELVRPQPVLFPQERELEAACGVIKDTCCYVFTSCAANTAI
jgi:hypothetical protein